MAKDYDMPDVRQLREEDCARAEFPVARRQDFRVYLDAKIHAQIAKHAGEDTSVEIGGVLVGQWQHDADGPFVMVSEFIRCDSADSKSAEVTFTHATWAKINQEMDTRFTELKIVGWYHSHPDFGVFLSERDTFIQQHFFSGAGQIAYVVDPIRETEGVFVWQEGKPALCSYYWVGDSIHAERHVEHSDASGSGGPATSEPSPAAPAGTELVSVMSTLQVCLPYVLVFFVGYLIAERMSHWQQRRLVEGTVAHYGIWKGLRPGLRKNLRAVDSELSAVSTEVGTLATEHVKLAGDAAAAKKKQWNKVQRTLVHTRRFLAEIENVYCLTPEEAAVVKAIIAAKTAGIADEKKKKDSEKADDKSKPSATEKKPPTTTGKGKTPQPKVGSPQPAADKPAPVDGDLKTEQPADSQPKPEGPQPDNQDTRDDR